jgi:menaquinone-dependent protoporphyrinogen IX oxidase
MGVGGYLRSGYEATFRRLAAIAPTDHDPALYDLVVIGTPIWNSSVSSPIRTWLEQHRQRLRNVAFFSTYGWRGARRVFDQMTELAAHQPLAILDVTERELEKSDLASRVGRFVTALEHVLRRHEAPDLHAVH